MPAKMRAVSLTGFQRWPAAISLRIRIPCRRTAGPETVPQLNRSMGCFRADRLAGRWPGARRLSRGRLDSQRVTYAFDGLELIVHRLGELHRSAGIEDLADRAEFRIQVGIGDGVPHVGRDTVADGLRHLAKPKDTVEPVKFERLVARFRGRRDIEQDLGVLAIGHSDQ